MENITEKIDEVLDKFDFEKVHHVMEFLEWTWGGDEDSHIPDIPELRKTARKLLKDASEIKKGRRCTSTGGFYAEAEYYRKQIYLRLYFAVEEQETDI